MKKREAMDRVERQETVRKGPSIVVPLRMRERTRASRSAILRRKGRARTAPLEATLSTRSSTQHHRPTGLEGQVYLSSAGVLCMIWSRVV